MNEKEIIVKVIEEYGPQKEMIRANVLSYDKNSNRSKKYLFSFAGVTVVILCLLNFKGNNIFDTNVECDEMADVLIDDSLSVPNEDIILKINNDFMFADTSVDLNNVEAIYDFSSHVVVGRILEKHRAQMYVGGSIVVTPGVIEVIDVIKGDLSTSKLSVQVGGGIVTLQDFLKSKQAEMVEKMGYDDLESENLKNQYVEYETDYMNNFEVGKTCVFIISIIPSDPSSFEVIGNVGLIPIEDESMVKTKADVLNLSFKME